jgi:hypothetical protein
MQSQEFVINQTRYGKCIKSLHKEIICLLIVFIDAFSSEIKELGHLSAFVVPSQHIDCSGKVKFERVEEKYYFT